MSGGSASQQQTASKIDLLFDPARLAVFDPNPLIINHEDDDIDVTIKQLTESAAVRLFNLIKTFEKEPSRDNKDTLIVMPKPVVKLPRQKPLPAEKQLTRWQEFAKRKGIKPKSHKPSIVYDEVKKDWVKRYGYRSATTIEDQKIFEITEKQAAEDFDPIRDAKQKRRDKVAKNDLNRLKNLSKQQKLASSKKVGDLYVKSKTKIEKSKAVRQDLRQEIEQAKKSTASIGNFQQRLRDEKPEKSAKEKRKFESNFADLKSEKAKMTKAANFVKKASKKVDVNAAANNIISFESKRDKSMMKSSKKGRFSRN